MAGGLWLFLSVSAVALFGVFIPVVLYIESRRKEREAFYKSETFRRVAEASGEGAKVALDLLREDDRLSRRRRIEGMKIGGIINIGVGIGLSAFLWSMGGKDTPYVIGLIPGLIGVGLLAYVYLLASPIETRSNH
ncbi:MAG TPA: DUF6249 domain-containing protein [Terracidiphilus sp.]|nr:DUF6249 domain-containing protein [Terracidiphilus sp.]